ncbi:MAG: glycosyl hydrolase [Chryseolinea sp.]
MTIDDKLTLKSFEQYVDGFWKLSAEKILSIEMSPQRGTPVFTVNGKYTSRGWTEWTQGFQYGSALLQFEATEDERFLEIGRRNTVDKMATHLTHNGVHDHGFNNLSTYGNLWRLMGEGRIPQNEWEYNFYTLAIKVSGAVQAMRWTTIPSGGFIYSFNGPQSLFVDTVRSCRALVLSHALGHALHSENDKRLNLLGRALMHLQATADYSIYYGNGRDLYDVAGRTAHECLFNVNDGNFRAPNAQQGFSGFTTWTRGLAWAMCGFAEQLEFLDSLPDIHFEDVADKEAVLSKFLKAAVSTCDFYINHSASDGIPYWDTGAPGLNFMGDYNTRPAEPFNEYEPVDSSAAAIGAQGLLRLGNFLKNRMDPRGQQYVQAGLTVARTLLSDKYLSSDPAHQGLILHSIYHRPNGWDNIPVGKKIPCGESSMWGDYHARELMVYLTRLIHEQSYHTFFSGLKVI